MLNYTEVALTWRELGYGQPRPDDVVAILRQFHRDSLLAVLIRLNLALTHQRGPSQEDIVGKWLVPDKADAVLRVLRQGPPTKVLFHEGQVLNAIGLALLHCPEDEGLRLGTMGDLEMLTRALLMLSALMFPEGQEELRRTGIFSTMTRGEVFRHDETYLPNIISRCYDLFVELPPIVHSGGPLRDFRALFRQATDMEFEDYLALAFGVLAFYDNLDPQNVGNAPVGVQRAAWLSDTLIAAEVRERLWAQLSLPLHRYRDELRAELERAGDAGRWAAMRVFSEHPMIEFPDGSLVCVSRRLLRDRFTHGIYWIIANSLVGNARNTFTNFFGEVFEEYIRRCMLRSLGRGFLARATYGPRARPLVDGGLVTPRSLGLTESKAARLLLRAREVGAEADLKASVERVLEEAASQLADAIRAGQEGQLAGLGVHRETRYYPIVVTYEPLPAHPFALELYDSILYRDGRLGGANVRPVTLMNTRDVESLEAIIGDGEVWPDFLSRKHTPKYRYLPFHNYVYERFSGEMPKNAYLAARWTRVAEMIGMRLFGESLTVAEPPRPRRKRRGRSCR